MFIFSLPAEGFNIDTTYRVKINGVYEQVLVEEHQVTIDPDGRKDVRQIVDVTENANGTLVSFVCSDAGSDGSDIKIIRPTIRDQRLDHATHPETCWQSIAGFRDRLKR